MSSKDATPLWLPSIGVTVAAVLLVCRPLVSAHPHEHDVEVNLEHESHVFVHVLDEEHYVKHLRPAATANDSVVVDVDLALLALRGLDISSGTLESTLRLFMKWEDPRLQWNITDYGGVKELPVPASRLWTPDRYLFSAPHGSHEVLNGHHAILHHDGVVTWLCDVMLRSTCPVNLSKFPFDSHTCVFELAQSFNLDDSIHLHIFHSPPGSIMDSSKDHVDTSGAGEWMLVANEVRVSASNHAVVLRVEVQRKSRLYQCVLVAPVVVLALLIPCIFLLPSDSTAKITLGGLLQVSMCICLRTLYDIVHGAHSSVPNIAIFGIASLALTSISILISAFVLSLTSRGRAAKPMPAWVFTIFLGRCGLRRWLCLGPYISSDTRHPPFSSRRAGNDNTMEADADVTSLKDSDSASDVKEMAGRKGAEAGGPGWREGGGEWREVARVLDRVFFVVFVVFCVLLSASLLS